MNGEGFSDWLVIGLATVGVVAICFVVGYWVVMR